MLPVIYGLFLYAGIFENPIYLIENIDSSFIFKYIFITSIFIFPIILSCYKLGFTDLRIDNREITGIFVNIRTFLIITEIISIPSLLILSLSCFYTKSHFCRIDNSLDFTTYRIAYFGVPTAFRNDLFIDIEKSKLPIDINKISISNYTTRKVLDYTIKIPKDYKINVKYSRYNNLFFDNKDNWKIIIQRSMFDDYEDWYNYSYYSKKRFYETTINSKYKTIFTLLNFWENIHEYETEIKIYFY